MMKSKKMLVSMVSFLILSLFTLAGCSSSTKTDVKETAQDKPAEQKTIVAKLGHVGAPDHIFEVGAKKFSELVSQKTNGQIKIETYPGGQLGGDRDVFEGLKMGTVEFAIEGPLDSFVPKTAIVSLPYMFNSPEHVYKFLDGPLGKEVYSGLKGMGIVHLSNMENGWRLITSNKAINSIEDLKGQKLRVPESPNFRNTFIGLGANPVPIAFTELYSAMQQGVVDGQENPVFHIYTQKFYEVQKFLALSKHMYLDAPLLASQKFWAKLTPEQQKAIELAAIEATNYQRKYAQEKEAELLKDLKAKGMKITEPDLAPFREATKTVHQGWIKEFGQETYDKIAALGSK